MPGTFLILMIIILFPWGFLIYCLFDMVRTVVIEKQRKPSRRKLIKFAIAIAVFIYFEFFFMGIKSHWNYVETPLTEKRAVEECPDIAFSANDEAWVRLAFQAVKNTGFAEGEYDLKVLGLPPHPDYTSANVTVKVSSSNLLNEESKTIHLSLDNIKEENYETKISMTFSDLAESFNKPDYDIFEYGKNQIIIKGVYYYKYYNDGVFGEEFADSIYTFTFSSAREKYSKDEMKHVWFAFARSIFIM